MATYRYLTTDILTGQVLSDSIPMAVQSFGAQLSSTGSLTGALDLQGPSQSFLAAGLPVPQQAYAVNRPYVEALDFRRSVIWALRDNYPMWCGINWDRPDMTRANGGPLQISAQTIDSVWSHRLITDTIEYQGIDLFAAFIDLVQYGMSKQSGYISSVSPAATRPAAYLACMASNGGVSSLVVPTGTTVPQAGVTWTAGYTYSDLTQVSSAWSDMTSAGSFDYAFVPGLDGNGNLAVFIQLGYTQLGRPPSGCGYSLFYGQGGNVLDYGYQQMGSQGSNIIWASAAPNGSAEQWQSQWPYGANLGDLDAGYPVMESTVSWTGSTVTSQGQIDAFADGQAQLAYEAMTTPTINIGDDQRPTLADITLGDTFWFSAVSPLHPANPDGTPGLQVLLRLTGWTAYPPGPQQAAYVQLSTTLA